MNILDALRNAMDSLAVKAREATVDPENRKGRFFSHIALKRIAIFAVIAFVASIFTIAIYNGKDAVFGNVEKMNEKLRNDEGLVDRTAIQTSIFNQDPTADLDKMLNGRLAGDSVGSTPSFDTGIGYDESNQDKLPTAADCSGLTDKVKAGEVLLGEDKKKMGECLDNNIMGFSDDEKAMLQALNNGDLTPEEWKQLIAGLNAKDSEGKNRGKAIAAAIMDPNKSNLRAPLQRALADGNESLAKAIEKKILGLPLDEEDKKKLASFITSAINSPVEALKNSLSGKAESGVNNDELIKKAVQQAQRDAEQAAQKAREAAEAQERAKEAYRKAGEGKPLSQADKDAIAKAARAQEEADKAAQRNDETREALSQVQAHIQSTATTIQSVIKDDLYSSYTILDENGNPVKVPRPRKRIVKNAKKIVFEKKPMIDIDRIRDDIYGSESKYTRRAAIDPRDADGFSASKTFTAGNKDTSVKLSKDIKALAVLESKLVYAQGAPPQRVVFRFYEDVYNPKTGELLIPSGSTAYAKTTSFDEQNGSMQLRVTEVAIGGGKTLDLTFSVGGIDGSEGVTGEVYDNKGKFYAGTIITSFAAGVTGFLAQTTVAEYMESKEMQDIILGSALGGTATVLKEIAEAIAKDMQNAPRILRVPKGVPVILYGGD